jgi:peptidoglycan/LPS O-acetylase OafA/YrhL
LPYAETKLAGTFAGGFAVALGYTATACAIVVVLEYLVRAPQSIAGRVLNSNPARHIGVISYSIYLWQQIFTSDPVRLGWWTYVFIFIVAEASYWLLERPLGRVRARLSSVGYAPDGAERTRSSARVRVSGASPKASIQ